MVDRVKGVEKVTDNPFLNLYNFDVEKEMEKQANIMWHLERRIQRSLKQQLIKIHLMV